MKEYNEINNTFIKTSGGGTGTSNYNDLENKPSINDVPLMGNKTLSQLGINLNDYYTKDETYTKEEVNNLIPSTEDFATKEELNSKQDKLINQANIKSINGNSILGNGNLEVADLEQVTQSGNVTGVYVTKGNDILGINLDTDEEGIIDIELGTKANRLVAPITSQYYVDNKVGVHMEVGVEKPYGTYTEDGVTYQVYSKIIKIDTLPAQAGIEGYPHGITGIKQILQVYGFTTDGFVLNAPRQNIQDNISIYQVQKAGNIAIEVGKDRSSKSAYVCLVYAKNN